MNFSNEPSRTETGALFALPQKVVNVEGRVGRGAPSPPAP
jgi:hypothetical protein